MWILYSFMFATFQSFRSIASKVVMKKELDERLALLYMMFFSIPVATIYILTENFRISSSEFWVFVILRILIDALALLFFFKALKLEDVSFVVPLLALQPILTIVTSLIINNQEPSVIGVLAVVLLSFAGYFLVKSEQKVNLKSERENLKKVTMLVLATVVLYSLVEPIHSEAIERSNEATYLFVSQVTFTVTMLLLSLATVKKDKIRASLSKEILFPSAILGILLGLEILTLFLAFGQEESLTAYVIAIGSTNIGLSAFLGFILFKEKFNLLKVISIACMVIFSAIIGFA